MNTLKIKSGLRAGMNNPASENCEQLGGISTILNIPSCGGEIGLCAFPSGKICEEWALMRGECVPDPMPILGANR
jgi:putative hemolysin